MEGHESQRLLTYEIYGDQLLEELNKAIDSAILGQPQKQFLGMFRLNHLYMQLYNENLDTTKDFKIECMSKILICNKIDTTWMRSTYQPPEEGESTDPGDVTANDGIGYMQIEGDGKTYPIFRIK